MVKPDRIRMSMILLEPAYKILHTTVKFKRREVTGAGIDRSLYGKDFSGGSKFDCHWCHKTHADHFPQAD